MPITSNLLETERLAMKIEFSVGRFDVITGMGFDSWALPLYLRLFPEGNWRAVSIQFLCFGVCVEWWLQDSARGES